MPSKRLRIWIVVADGTRARFFSVEGDTLVPARSADLTAPLNRRPARDLKSDRPGRGFAHAGSHRRSALEPRHDFHKIEKHRFAVSLAEVLEAASASKTFDQLVIVAPHRTLGELRGLLPARVKGLVTQEIAKELTNETTANLWRRLRPLLRPAAVAQAAA